jgi:Anthranilate/para-aminobenzoate synthases component I
LKSFLASKKVKRRFYAGAVGYMESDGDLDFCIAIRCCLKQGKTISLQAGGGIVAASNADREFEEQMKSSEQSGPY